jgi:manganese/zinc/iron transport system substrate-binding protein
LQPVLNLIWGAEIAMPSADVSRRVLLSHLAAVVFVPATRAFAAASSQQPKTLNIVATTAMIGDAVRQVAGERAGVTALMGEGVDPHTYRQTRSDVVAMTRADAVFWHGLNLEAQLAEFFADLGRRKPVVALGERVPRDRLLDDPAAPGKPDPHVWMDPRLWREVVVAARDELVRLDPAGQSLFEANAARFLDEIDRLAAYADRALATVPQSSRVLVTAHDAFNYFGRAYRYDVVGIQGISTESEAGLRQIEDIVKLLLERKIRSVFVESSVSERNVRALVEGAAARGHTVAIGGQLFSDAMGRPGTYEGTYIGMIDHNVTVITRALGGDTAKAGLNGRLAAQ